MSDFRASASPLAMKSIHNFQIRHVDCGYGFAVRVSFVRGIPRHNGAVRAYLNKAWVGIVAAAG